MRQRLTIRGMHCPHCVAAVQEVLQDIGATDITVSLPEQTALCQFDGTEETLRAALAAEGFTLVQRELLA